jgi:hypothetical protein
LVEFFMPPNFCRGEGGGDKGMDYPLFGT